MKDNLRVKSRGRRDDGRLPLVEYMRSVAKGRTPQTLSELMNFSDEVKDEIRLREYLGELEPVTARRPTVLETLNSYERRVVVPPAKLPSTEDIENKENDSRVKVNHFVAPSNLVVVLTMVRIHPANLTAIKFGEVEYRGCVQGTGQLFCEPVGNLDRVGTLMSVGNIFMPPGFAFDLFVRNHDTCSEAVFTVGWSGWATR